MIIPLEENLDHFWSLAEPLESFRVAIKAPAIEIPLLKRLGEPTFMADPGLQNLLLPAYRAISQAAIQTAFGEVSNEID